MNTINKIIVILLSALSAGLLFNQFSANGIKWPMLLPASLLSSGDQENAVHIVSADSLFLWLEEQQVVLIDIRSAEDFQLDHIPGAIHLPFSEIFSRMPEWEKTPPRGWVIYDQEGDMENLNMAASELIRKGYRPVYLLFGGYLSWLDARYPVKGRALL